jgi:hypothetical protein
MPRKYIDFKESTITELTNFIQSQARAVSLADLDRLMIDLPALRERFARIPSRTHAYLPDQLEFLCLFVEERVARRAATWRKSQWRRRHSRCSILSGRLI